MSTTADIAIIGGGVFGCSVAYALSRAGASTILLDASMPGRATSASAGGLWPVGESLGLGCGVIDHVEGQNGDSGGGPKPLPREFMEFLRQSNRRFPSLADELREAAGVDIELEQNTGLLYLLYDDDQVRHARGILEWMGADDPGLCAWTPEQVFDREPLLNRDLKGALHFPGDHQVNPMLLTHGLGRAAVAARCRLVPEARVTALRKEDPDAEERGAIYRAWRAVYGDEEKQLKDITALALRIAAPDSSATTAEHELIDAFAAISRSGKYDQKAATYWLRRNKGRVRDWLRLKDRPGHTKTKHWYVEDMKQKP